MVTGKYVEVYREASTAGERRRYTKRFLATREGDFREWTEREWRTLARLVGHGARHVPDVVQYDRCAAGGDALVQTYDAGVTVDHWVTLLPVQRDGRVQRHIFQDCAHWWALARHLLLALHEIHPLRLVHLDLKADNICVPLAPASFNPANQEQCFFPAFENIALIDFAFSVVTGEALASPLPIGRQRTYRYQSPRLLQALIAGKSGDLQPTRWLDWRCDMYSLAALLEVLLPSPEELCRTAEVCGWTANLDLKAKTLLLKIRQSHDREISDQPPHLALAAECAVQLETAELAGSLQRGWTLACGRGEPGAAGDAMTTTVPVTRFTLLEPHQVFAPVTEVLSQSANLGIGNGADLLFGFGAVTQPAAELNVSVPDLPVTDVFAVTPGHRNQADGSQPTTPTTSADMLVANAEDTNDQIPRSVPSTTQAPVQAVPSPVENSLSVQPSPVPLPAVPARHAAREKRPIAVYLLPVLAFVSAMAWRLAHDTKSVDDPRAASPSSADVAVVISTGKASPAAQPASAGSAAAREQLDETPPAVAAPPFPATPGRRPELRPDASPPVADTQEFGQTASSPELPSERFAQQAQQNLTAALPQVVASAEPRVAQVLSFAHRAEDSSDDRRTFAAAALIGDGVFKQTSLGVAAGSPVLARQLNAEAHRAFYQEHRVVQAYQLQRRAFDAHPADVEIAGNLAFYALKMDPPRAEESRALAIYALALSTRAQGTSRTEDWGNLAVASALSGRSEDARDAMLVLLSMSKDINRSCHSALSSVASHGQKMQMPAEALLLRAQYRIDITRAPQCQVTPKWRGH